MKHQYQNPIDLGFEKIAISRRKHNRMVPMRKQKPGMAIEYYYHRGRDVLLMQYIPRLWLKIFLTIALFVPAVLIQGVAGSCKEVADLWAPKRRGSFSCDQCAIGGLKAVESDDSELRKHVLLHILFIDARG